MVLSSHAVTGAAVALFLRLHPILALAAAFSSHFLLDAVPHWHYQVLSRSPDKSSPSGEKIAFGKDFIKDILRTGLDFGIGLGVAFAVSENFFPGYLWLAALGAFSGVLPDLLQVIYFRFPNFPPLFYLQWFHKKIHSKKRLDGKPMKGIFYQIAMSTVIVWAIIAVR